MRQLLEGSQAIAQAVAACRPQVVSAYPITPQTHIVEDLVELAASGKLSVECLNVESEFAAASVVLGATAAGSRAYTATSSQGLLLMTEVLYNIAGLRLPIVLTGANRAISAPLNIWNDHQDVMAVRDSGWIQLFAADNQEAADLHPQAYRLAEQLRVPVMVNVDGFILTHALEPVEVPDQALVDQFLPPLSLRLLEPAAPRSIGMMVEPDKYAEVRYAQHQVLLTALKVIPPLGEQFRELFGRPGLQLVQPYRMAGSEPAATAVVCLGSVSGTVQEAIDRLRADGWPVGSVAIQTYRPFPAAALRQTLGACGKIVVLEKAVAPGTPTGAIVAAEIAAAMYGRGLAPLIRPYILGLGGRDVTVDDICRIVAETHQTPAAELTSSDDGGALDGQFYRLNWELLGGEVAEQWQTR